MRIDPFREDAADGCDACGHFAPTDLFDLCHHARAAYSVAGRGEFHTCTHMRQDRGPCGPDARLRAPMAQQAAMRPPTRSRRGFAAGRA